MHWEKQSIKVVGKEEFSVFLSIGLLCAAPGNLLPFWWLCLEDEIPVPDERLEMIAALQQVLGDDDEEQIPLPEQQQEQQQEQPHQYHL